MNVSALVEKVAIYLQGIYFVCKFLTKPLILFFPVTGIDPTQYKFMHNFAHCVPGENPVSLCLSIEFKKSYVKDMFSDK